MIWSFDQYQLDTEVFELRRSGERVALTRLAFDLLRYLIERSERVVERDELLEALWPGESVVYSALARQVLLLRKALGDDAGEGRYVRTVRRRGYRFVASARAAADSPSGVVMRRDHASPRARAGKVPAVPRLVVGRSRELAALMERLLRPPQARPARQALTAVHGWPGVGKTTLAAALAWECDVQRAFPDGVLWASLGPRPDVHSELTAWCRALGIDGVDTQRMTARELSERLSHQLRERRVLFIVDDVWSFENLAPLRLGGPNCAALITSRMPSLADGLAHGFEIFRLDVLAADAAFDLLATLVPDIAAQHPDLSRELVAELEGLPLALHVACNLLKAEVRRGFKVVRLLSALRSDLKRLLAAEVPSDLAAHTAPTVAARLETSTDALDALTRRRFAQLAPFAPNPAIFDVDAMRCAWRVEDPVPTLAELVDRGLLEHVAPGRYKMQSLFKAHAEVLHAAASITLR